MFMVKMVHRHVSLSQRLYRLSFISLLFIFASLNTSCGGGGGTTIMNPNYGAVEGYVYAPVGSTARLAEAAPVGFMAVSGAGISISCGGTSKNTTTNSSGTYKITLLPVGNCSLTVTKSGYGSYQTNVSITANSTTTVGGSGGILLTPTTSGAIHISANTAGGDVIIDRMNTNIKIPSNLNYTFNNVSPGTHAINIELDGFESTVEQNVNIIVGETASLHFILNPIGNVAPVADAGDDVKGFVGTKYTAKWTQSTDGSYAIYEPEPAPMTISLDGSKSSDPDNDSLTYNWTQESGPEVTLINPNTSTPYFSPSSEGTYSFSLRVNDGYLQSASDTISVYVERPNGKIAFTAPFTSYSYDIATMNADGSNISRLTYPDALSQISDHPSWSRDGRKIIYVETLSGNATLNIMNSDGSSMQIVVDDGIINISPDWSIVDDTIAFSRGSYFTQVYSMLSDGTDMNQLTNMSSKLLGTTKISPDGSKILFSSLEESYAELWIMNSDGSNLRRLTNSSNDEEAVWMPDGRILVRSSKSYGEYAEHLYTINSDGTGYTEINHPSYYGYIYNIEVSDDGKYIFFNNLNNEKLYIMYSDGSGIGDYGDYPLFYANHYSGN